MRWLATLGVCVVSEDHKVVRMGGSSVCVLVVGANVGERGTQEGSGMGGEERESMWMCVCVCVVCSCGTSTAYAKLNDHDHIVRLQWNVDITRSHNQRFNWCEHWGYCNRSRIANYHQ